MPKQALQRIIDNRNRTAINKLQTQLSAVAGTYVAASEYDDATILAKLLHVDGAASGLDADMVDAKHAADFVLASALNESIDDRVAALLQASATVTWTYDDAANTLTPALIPGGVTGVDHGAGLVGLLDDDHTQYTLLAGRVGGQILYGGTGSSDLLRLYGYAGGSVYAEMDGSGFNIVRDGGQSTQTFTTYAASAQSTMIFRRALGSLASPADVTSGQTLGRMVMQGYVNGAFSGSRALLLAYAAENWSSTVQGTRWAMQSTEAGGTTALWNWSVDGSGNFRLFLVPTTAIGTSAKYVLAFGAQGTAPTTSPTDMVQLWNANQNSEAGNAALLILTEAAKTLSYGNRLRYQGGLQTSLVTKTADYTLALTDHTVVANKATAITFTLPTAASAWDSTLLIGTEFFIKNIGAGTLTVDANGSETIDGALTQTVAQWGALHIQSDGTTWYIL